MGTNYGNHGSIRPLNWQQPAVEEPIKKSTTPAERAEVFHRHGTPPTRRGMAYGAPSVLQPNQHAPELSPELILEKSVEAPDLLKAKYTRREGTKGNYKYFYGDDDKKGSPSPHSSEAVHAEERSSGKYHVESHGAGIHAVYHVGKGKRKPRLIGNARGLDAAKQRIDAHHDTETGGAKPVPKGPVSMSSLMPGKESKGKGGGASSMSSADAKFMQDASRNRMVTLTKDNVQQMQGLVNAGYMKRLGQTLSFTTTSAGEKALRAHRNEKREKEAAETKKLHDSGSLGSTPARLNEMQPGDKIHYARTDGGSPGWEFTKREDGRWVNDGGSAWTVEDVLSNVGGDGTHTIREGGKGAAKSTTAQAIDLLKAKYTRREGSPGNYKYFYDDKAEAKTSSGKDLKEMSATEAKNSGWNHDEHQEGIEHFEGKLQDAQRELDTLTDSKTREHGNDMSWVMKPDQARDDIHNKISRYESAIRNHKFAQHKLKEANPSVGGGGSGQTTLFRSTTAQATDLLRKALGAPNVPLRPQNPGSAPGMPPGMPGQPPAPGQQPAPGMPGQAPGAGMPPAMAGRPQPPGVNPLAPPPQAMQQQGAQQPIGITPSGLPIYPDPFHPAHQAFDKQDHAVAAQQQQQAGNAKAAEIHNQLGEDNQAPMDRAADKFGGTPEGPPGQTPAGGRNNMPGQDQPAPGTGQPPAGEPDKGMEQNPASPDHGLQGAQGPQGPQGGPPPGPPGAGGPPPGPPGALTKPQPPPTPPMQRPGMMMQPPMGGQPPPMGGGAPAPGQPPMGSPPAPGGKPPMGTPQGQPPMGTQPPHGGPAGDDGDQGKPQAPPQMGPERDGPKPGMMERPPGGPPQGPPGAPPQAQPGMPPPPSGPGPQLPMSAQQQGMSIAPPMQQPPMPGMPGQQPPMPGMPGQPPPMPGQPQMDIQAGGVMGVERLLGLLGGVGAPQGPNMGSSTMQQPQGQPQGLPGQPPKPAGAGAPATNAASQDTPIERLQGK
jgi:hypothetical protein